MNKSKIAYIDLEFKDKKIGDKTYKQPTEIGYAWFSNQKKLNFNNYHLNYDEELELVLKQLKKIIEEAKKKYNFDTLIFWDSRQDIKILEQAKIELSRFKIEDLQENIATLTNGNRSSLQIIDTLLNLTEELTKETLHLKLNEQEKNSLKIHTALGDSSRIAIIDKKIKQNQIQFINTLKKQSSSINNTSKNEIETTQKSTPKKEDKELLKKSILQNIPLTEVQIKKLREGILILLSLETLSEKERELEEIMLKKNQDYLLVKKLQEKNYDVKGFPTELLKINRFLKINFNITIKDLYNIDFNKL